MAAVLAVGDQAVLSHRSAATLWGLAAPGEAIEVSTPRNARSREGLRVRRTPSLIASDRDAWEGVPCTSVGRTLADLAAVARSTTVKAAVRQAEFDRRFDLRAINALFDREPGHRGRRRLAAALSELSIGIAATRSELEDRFLTLIAEARLPRPEVNVHLTMPDGTIYVADFLWRGARLIAETDGFAAHASQSSFYADSRRALRLRPAGFDVLRFTWADVTDRPDDVAADLRNRL